MGIWGKLQAEGGGNTKVLCGAGEEACACRVLRTVKKWLE